MGKAPARPRLAGIISAALLGLASGWTTDARAALSDQLCGAAATAVVRPFPTSADLTRAAAATESRLARREGVELFQSIAEGLDVPAVTAERPTPASIAEYCAAAGELMRISPQGSQFQAQSYLLNAFRLAQGNSLQGIASLTAYRLGLVSLSGPTVAGARGARGKRGGTTAAVRDASALKSLSPCDVLLNRGALSNTNLALSFASLECSAQQARSAGDMKTAALATLRLARLRLALAEANIDVATAYRIEAGRLAIQGLAYARPIEDPALRAEVMARLVSAAIEAGGSSAAILEPAVVEIRDADPGNPATGAFAAALRARLTLADGNAPAARRLLEDAMLLESQRPLPSRLPEWRLLMADADPENRETHILAAFDALEAIRPLLPRFDPLTEETAFSLYMRRVFQTAVDVQLTSAEGPAEVVRVRAAQKIVEAYRQAELQSVFGSECIPARDPLRPETLNASEVLLYPILLPDRLEILYIAGGSAGKSGTFRRLPPNRNANRETVSRLVETLVLSLSYDEDDSWRQASRQLYDLLIKPVESELKPGSVLAVVPDGALRALPFSVLLDADNHYLVERTRVSVAPSLAYSQPGGRREEVRQEMVSASLELEVNLPAGYFEKLSGTAEEAREAALVDGKRISRALFLENFTKRDLIDALTRDQVDVLHLATHASFNGRSDRAFIVANGEIILLSELRQILSQNRTRGDELDLLVLSACETAVGDDEASMGLAGAAVQAGARSVIASLWPVNDAGTTRLMKSFYERYRSGSSKSASLREAQLAMIEAGGASANPNIWAAFTLLGAWR